MGERERRNAGRFTEDRLRGMGQDGSDMMRRWREEKWLNRSKVVGMKRGGRPGMRWKDKLKAYLEGGRESVGKEQERMLGDS